MDTQTRLDLEDLRTAALQREQEKLQFLLKRLLQSLDYFMALAVPLERIQAFLPKFEGYYPEETWVRKLLLMVINYGKAPDNDIAALALEQSFSAAGMGNFLKAVYDLNQAMQDGNTPEVRIGFMASAVVNIIMAELAEAWYGKHPKAWERVRAGQEPHATTIALTFWTDSQTAERDTAAWLAVGDSIEAKLTRKKGKS
jgi:hypothetical protein